MPALSATPIYQIPSFNQNGILSNDFIQQPSAEFEVDFSGSYDRTNTSLTVEPGSIKSKIQDENKFGFIDDATSFVKQHKRHDGQYTNTSIHNKEPFMLPRKSGFVSDQILHYNTNTNEITDPYVSAPNVMYLEPTLELPKASSYNKAPTRMKMTIKNDTTNNALGALYDQAKIEKNADNYRQSKGMNGPASNEEAENEFDDEYDQLVY